MHHDFVYLASASPRRRELLEQIGVAYRSRPVCLDESPRPGEIAGALVQRLAAEKASDCLSDLGEDGGRPVVAADTVVVQGERILGKPRDEAHGLEMLALLSGNTHEVLTAVSVRCGEFERTVLSRSRVEFRVLPHHEREAYWATGEPLDKAGAYAIQGFGAAFVSRLEGSYSGVMGLPLFETVSLLREVGVEIFCFGPDGVS